MDRMGKRNTEVQKEQCSKIACPRLAEITIILSAIQNFISGISCEIKGSDIPPKSKIHFTIPDNAVTFILCLRYLQWDLEWNRTEILNRMFPGQVLG